MAESPRQNRVTPTGAFVATSARGTFMGNRGCIHNANQQIQRRWKAGYFAWITCVLDFKGRKRTLMQPGRYTELFFLDEATAFSAGHRPCGECRREDYQRFMQCWHLANDAIYGSGLARMEIDRILHQERVDTQTGMQLTYSAPLAKLPNGTFIAGIDNTPFLVWGEMLYAWSPSGYTSAISKLSIEATEVTVLTPKSIVAALRVGYVSLVHASAAVD
jgi:hypothetical protein